MEKKTITISLPFTIKKTTKMKWNLEVHTYQLGKINKSTAYFAEIINFLLKVYRKKKS